MHEEQAKRLARVMNVVAPAKAFSGKWIQTVEQAGVSSCKGGFADRDGNRLPSSSDRRLFDAVGDAIAEIFLAGDQSWNIAEVNWRAPDMAVTIETSFDPEIVPRNSGDPTFEQAATARRDFWNLIGRAAEAYVGPLTPVNDYGQTRWISPHRRLLQVEVDGWRALVTDGLSTPWPGVPDKVNGSCLELFLEMPEAQSSVDPWIDIMMGLGDMVADDVGIESYVVENAAILFCDLPVALAPYTHVILSVPSENEPREIPSLPYGSAKILRVTAVTLEDLAGQSLDGWGVDAAHQALARRLEAKAVG